MEPVLILHAAGISHPSLQVTMRDVPEVSMWLSHALAYRPRLLGDRYSAADLLVHSPYASFTDATPDDPAIRDWVARCMARPATARTRALDAALPARAA